MILNLNIGILGHVDSGKTSLAKVLSQIPGTAAFDKNPQSQERGITIDLGFSSLTVDIPEKLKSTNFKKLQFTFVDCPGHASLIKTIIGGAQIIDFMILVIDITKGIQTQTAECIVIGELTCSQMVVLLNKIDLVEGKMREKIVEKISKRIKGVLAKTAFDNTPILTVSASQNINIDKAIDLLKDVAYVPKRNLDLPFIFAVDHCFSIKGQGTICTGTVLQGKINVNDEIEIPLLKEKRKIKSMQMFRIPQNSAGQGDRLGICLPKIDASNFERGLLATTGYVLNIRAAIINLIPIKYYKGMIASKTKYHLTIGYETTLATITLFTSEKSKFSFDNNFKYLDAINEENLDMENQQLQIFALLEFEKSIISPPKALVIGSKLDLNIHTPSCRLSFHGSLLEMADDKCVPTFVNNLKVFKIKRKEGKVLRVVSSMEIITSNLFKKETNRQLYMGMKVILMPGNEVGVIESTFGKTSKVKVKFSNPISDNSLKEIESNQAKVVLEFKKYVFDKSCKVLQ